MEAYSGFAQVYDIFMDETPYEQWKEYVQSVFEKFGIKKDDIVLDLGCGTGTLTGLLADAGYDMIGIDDSEEMLNIALCKKAAAEKGILYLKQDMREFELFGTVKAVISVCDSLNYLLEEKELLAVFRLVNNYLDPQGIFLFDFNTVYKYATILGDTTIAENREECSFIWENFFYEEKCINEYELTVFQQEETGLFRRFTENHFQRGYTLETMKDLVGQAGLTFLAAVDADTQGEVRADSERIYVLAQSPQTWEGA